MADKHEKILEYVTNYILERGYSPSLREIAEGVGYTSTATVFNHLRDMRSLGLIHYVDECPRTITLPGYRYIKVERRCCDGRRNNQRGKERSGAVSRIKMV